MTRRRPVTPTLTWAGNAAASPRAGGTGRTASRATRRAADAAADTADRSAGSRRKCRWRLLESMVMEQAHAPAYRLVRRPLPTAPAARLDEAQQAVVDHAGGPLLVLAGPV